MVEWLRGKTETLKNLKPLKRQFCKSREMAEIMVLSD
jgi:hypothetical protein